MARGRSGTEPTTVLAGGRAVPEARAKLVDPDNTLVTFPGDRYTLVYRLPSDAARYELFRESQGYYLEWMREEWLEEEDLTRAAGLFLNPTESLRRLAPELADRRADRDRSTPRGRRS